MSDENSNVHPMPGGVPVVFERDGGVFANSRDVAAFFGKRHDHVLRDIDNLLKDMPAPDLGAAPFLEAAYFDANNQTRRCIDMSRDGFTLLGMGFTGAKALEFKLKYMAQFNAMESALRNRAAGFQIPTTLSEALRLAADQADTIDRQKLQIAATEAKVAEQAPKVDVYDRIANGDGLFNLTHAAKILHQQPHAFNKRLAMDAWIYKRVGSDRWTAYQDKLHRGLLEHKTTTVTRTDGTEKVVDQVMVTPKGLVALAKKFGMPPGQINTAA